MYSHAFVMALALVQQPQQQQPEALQPSPVARIEITPRAREVVAGDSVRYEARPLDASGKPVENARISFRARGGQGEGTVDSTGKVVASSVGKMPISVIALVPGARPFVDSTFELRMVPGPATRIDVPVRPSRLVVGQSLLVTAVPFSRRNDRARDAVRWTSSAPAIVRVDDSGLITAGAPGRATLTARAAQAQATVAVQVIPAALSSVSIKPTRSNVRTGDVVRFTIDAKDRAGAAVAGLTPTWSFSPGDGQMDADGSFVAYRPGDYVVTANLGPRSAIARIHVGERDVRRNVSVVSRLPRTQFATSEVWIHPNGKVAYLGTHMGGDRVYAIDITNPAQPVIVDSVMANTRLVNDMVTTADGNVMIFTREGAADRKNGIVITDSRDPLHPKAISEFTEGVTAGVHSLYVYENPKFGKFVFLTNDGTGAIHGIDITDPAHPRQVSEFRTDRPDAARYVHDLDIVDGLMYASYWNDGLVILDIGNGIKGGTPSKPALVSQFKYDLDSLYREVEAASAPGFTRGTHTAWRQRDGKYVFIADEVYRNGNVKGAKDASANRMYGTLQVVDVSDIEHPKSVAWYTPENGGVHNVWVVKDTLYLGAYEAGFHVFDISGDLKGDLRAQDREIASLNTADMDGWQKNAANDWGVVVNPKDGLAYVNDFYNGLWVIRVEPKKPRVVP
ncbi:MAG TPA: Ig-like domain-containing protein [Gemmatimonadaceae bacterium]|nr:Ig-like domain-containing protein [Gemmatimonadaceae bacterium]